MTFRCWLFGHDWCPTGSFRATCARCYLTSSEVREARNRAGGPGGRGE